MDLFYTVTIAITHKPNMPPTNRGTIRGCTMVYKDLPYVSLADLGILFYSNILECKDWLVLEVSRTF